MRIAFITSDLAPWGGHLTPGGCSYYRCLLPKNAAGPQSAFGLPAWTGEHGFGVIQADDTALFGFDTVVLKMLMERWTPTQMIAAKRLGQRLIVDVDDHYDGLHAANRALKATDPSVNKLANRAIHDEVIALADVLTVSTPFLYDWYKGKGIRDVRLIRNGINPNQFKPRKQRNRKPVLGWTGAIGWRSNDVETLRPWLGDFLEQHDLMFHHSGHMPDVPSFADLAGVDTRRVTTSPMVAIPEYADQFTFDVGIVPLADIPFNHAKSTIKGLEYAAAGVPFVAQALPEYDRLALYGVGRAARTADDWVRNLTELIDYRTRKHEAVVNRQRTMTGHTIVQTAHQWAALFSEGNMTQLPSRLVRYVHR